MKFKSLISIGLVLLVGGLCLYIFLIKKNSNPEAGNIPSVQMTEELREPIDPRVGKERILPGEVINGFSIKELEGSSRNPLIGVFLGDQKVGELNALEVYMPIFSPDGSMAVFETSVVCGAGCIEFESHVLNLADKSVSRIRSPRDGADFPNDQANGREIEYATIPLEWIGGSTLRLKGYFITYDAEGYYRVSSEEMWSYDTTNATYSLE